MNFIFGYFMCGLVYACLYDLVIRPVLPRDGYEEYFNKVSARICMSIVLTISWLPVIALNIYYGIMGKR